MDDAAKARARETRRRNEAARAARWEEEAELKRAARVALKKVFENGDATPEQILTAAQMLIELGKY